MVTNYHLYICPLIRLGHCLSIWNTSASISRLLSKYWHDFLSLRLKLLVEKNTLNVEKVQVCVKSILHHDLKTKQPYNHSLVRVYGSMNSCLP